MVVMSDEQAQIRDTVMTTRGFLLRGIQAAAGNIPNEREAWKVYEGCLLYTSPSPRDRTRSRMPSSA